MDIVILLFGLALLVIGGELVVSNGVKVAEFFRVSPLIIGLTIVAIGTSLPELAVGIDGMRRGVGDIVLGNMTGTDIVNVLFILGLSALIRPLAVPPGVLSVDLPMMTISSAVVLFLAWDGYLSRIDGIILLVGGLVYMIFIITHARRRDNKIVVDETKTETDLSEEAARVLEGGPSRKDVVISSVLLIIGLATIIFGADQMLRGAVAIAYDFGLSETLVGLTIIAIGTSAPELVTTIIATIKDERGLAFGNLVGSSTLNLTLILGPALLFSQHAVPVDPKLTHLSMPLMVLVGLACIPVFLTGRRISRLEGGLFVAAYAAYLSYTIATA